MITNSNIRLKWRTFAVPVVIGCAAVIAGCASERAPIDAVSTADMAINRALDAEASELAPLDLRLAREKLDLAKANMNEKNYTQARRQAEEARVDARVAEARAKAKNAMTSTGNVRQTIKVLNHDIEQKSIAQ